MLWKCWKSQEWSLLCQHPQLIQTKNTIQASDKWGGIRKNLKLSCLPHHHCSETGEHASLLTSMVEGGRGGLMWEEQAISAISPLGRLLLYYFCMNWSFIILEVVTLPALWSKLSVLRLNPPPDKLPSNCIKIFWKLNLNMFACHQNNRQ